MVSEVRQNKCNSYDDYYNYVIKKVKLVNNLSNNWANRGLAICCARIIFLKGFVGSIMQSK